MLCYERVDYARPQVVEQAGAPVEANQLDWSPGLLEDLRAGVIDSLVAQHPFRMGEMSVQAAIAKLKGQEVVKINNIAPRLLLKDNLDTPEVQAQIMPDLKKYLKE